MTLSKLQAATADHAKLFRSTLEQFRYRYDLREVFRDWTELAAAEIHQMPYHAGICEQDEAFERVEAEYLAVAKRYERPDFDIFADLLAITRAALHKGYQDFLGSAFMQLEINSDWHAQFFTPYAVSRLMVNLTLDGVKEIIDAKGYFTLLEPACGAGGMIIAAAQMVHEIPRNPTTGMFFQAIDLDRLCANMTYIQTGLLGLTGAVWHGNTLTMEMTSYRYTPAARMHPARVNRILANEPLRDEPTKPEPQQEPLADPASPLADLAAAQQMPLFELEAT